AAAPRRRRCPTGGLEGGRGQSTERTRRTGSLVAFLRYARTFARPSRAKPVPRAFVCAIRRESTETPSGHVRFVDSMRSERAAWRWALPFSATHRGLHNCTTARGRPRRRGGALDALVGRRT